MSEFGVTPDGFNRPSVQDLLTRRNGEQRATISQGLDVSPESIMGQANAIGCRQLAVAWEALDTCYNGFDPDRAEDFLLTAVCKLTGTQKEGATKSTVIATVNLDDGTTLENGVHFAHVEGKPSVRFTPQEDYTAVGDGDVDLTFEAETAGPIAAEADTLTVIATAVNGWNSVTNDESATLGAVADTDATLRAKRESQLAAAGSQTAKAIISDVLQLGAWVKSVRVFENESSNPDADGRPPNSFEVLINDENAPVDADNQIAQAIWNNKPSGIRSFGIASDQGNAENERGEIVVVPFSRVTSVDIYIEMTLTTTAGFNGNAAVKSYVVDQSTQEYDEAGEDVIALFVKGLPLDLEGVTDVPSFAIGTAPSPTAEDNITIDVREQARFDVANIVIS